MRLRPLIATAAALVAAVAASLVTAAPATAAPAVDATPTHLPRGADLAAPHLDGRTIVEGAVRIRVRPGGLVRLLGKAGTAYVVTVTSTNGLRGRLVRYTADGASTTIGRGDFYDAELSGDGARVLLTRTKLRPETRTVVEALDSTTGALSATTVVKGFASVLDATGDTAVLGSWAPHAATRRWTLSTGAVTRVARRTGYAADVAHDLLASYTDDPYDGGCTVVSRLSDPTVRLWRSCRERVEEFSTDGSHLALVDILSDGIGPGAVLVRTTSGTPVATYVLDRGWFGRMSFESPTTLVAEAFGPRRGAVVRCDAQACERASGYVRSLV